MFSFAGGIQTLSLRANSEKRHDSHEKLTDYQSTMASSSRGTGSEDNDSDFDNQSHEDDIDNDDEQINIQKQEEDERQKQLIVNNFRSIFSSNYSFCFCLNLVTTAKNSLEYYTRMVA